MDQKVEETFTVVYNDCYGGFGMSPFALNEYNKRLLEHEEPLKDIYSPLRDDKILIDLCKEFGDKVNDKCSKLTLKSFPIQYESFLEWNDYDGKESVSVDYRNYVLHRIREISEEDNGTMEEIRAVLNEYKLEIFPKLNYNKY